MLNIDRLTNIPYFKNTLYSYFLLGFTDVVHHWHAAVAFNDTAAVHAVLVGLFLLPIAFYIVAMFCLKGKIRYLFGFLSISSVAMIFPGFYHGGWHHFFKLTKVVWDLDTSGLELIIPPFNFHLWFYELSGVLEFVLGILLAFYTFKTLTNTVTFHSSGEAI